MINPSSLTHARSSAINYLSKREHSELELRHKLTHKGFETNIIDQVLSQLQIDNLLSNERFVEAYVHSRIKKGFGPLRIQQELRERGITGELQTEHLDTHDPVWITYARKAREKRFGQNWQGEREFGKQVRFLQYRGFTSSQIKAALAS